MTPTIARARSRSRSAPAASASFAPAAGSIGVAMCAPRRPTPVVEPGLSSRGPASCRPSVARHQIEHAAVNSLAPVTDPRRLPSPPRSWPPADDLADERPDEFVLVGDVAVAAATLTPASAAMSSSVTPRPRAVRSRGAASMNACRLLGRLPASGLESGHACTTYRFQVAQRRRRATRVRPSLSSRGGARLLRARDREEPGGRWASSGL